MNNRNIIFLFASVIALSLLSAGQALDPWQIYDKLEKKYRIKCDTFGIPVTRMDETTIWVSNSLDTSYLMLTNEEQDIYRVLNSTNNWAFDFLMSGSNSNTVVVTETTKSDLRETNTPTTGRTVPAKANASGGQ